MDDTKLHDGDPLCRHRTPALWPFLVVCAIVGTMISLGGFHSRHCGDSLIPILVSLQKWTPFFWEQDRVGMLVPLLTLPVRNPLLNLLAQDAIYASSTLAAMFLLTRFMLRDGNWWFAGTWSAFCFLCLASAGWNYDFSAVTFYGVWLALGLAGLVMVDGQPRASHWWRWLLAFGLLILAHWVYSAAVLLLGPLVVARFFLCRRPLVKSDVSVPRPLSSTRNGTILLGLWRVATGELALHLVLIGLAFVTGMYFLKSASLKIHSQTDLSSVAIAQWPWMWKQLWENAWKWLAPYRWPCVLLGTALFGLVQIFDPARRAQAGTAARAALALALCGAFFFLFMGTREWVRMNDCNTRYAFPAIFFLQGALAILGVCQLPPAVKEQFRRRPFVLSLTALLVAGLLTYHSPSIKRVRRDLDRTLGARTADILEGRCTHVAGDYWRVWPSVFHANLVLYNQHEKRTVWGITFRCGPSSKQWNKFPLEQFRIAVPLEDEQTAQFWLQTCGFPAMVEVERRSTITVLRPAAAVLAEQKPRSDKPGPISRDSHAVSLSN